MSIYKNSLPKDARGFRMRFRKRIIAQAKKPKRSNKKNTGSGMPFI